MKRSYMIAKVVLLPLIQLFALNAGAQDRYVSGPYKGFVREKPELNKVELGEPIAVRTVAGVILSPDRGPLRGTLFEIRDRSGKILSALSDDTGAFEIRHLRSGTYAFKATKNGFHSVVGTIVVSSKASPRNSIRIQVKVGT